MAEARHVVAIVEGATEQIFVKSVVAPYLAQSGVFLRATVLGKAGQKGGNVRFERARRDIRKHLRQRRDTWVTLLVDYYGIGKDWLGREPSKHAPDPEQKARILTEATSDAVREEVGTDAARRFIPYVSMFELEALYFSEAEVLSRFLGIGAEDVKRIVRRFGEPEKIDDSPNGAPSKRLAELQNRFRKTTTGIEIAREIGIDRMRAACPLFGAWITRLEALATPAGRGDTAT